MVFAHAFYWIVLAATLSKPHTRKYVGIDTENLKSYLIQLIIYRIFNSLKFDLYRNFYETAARILSTRKHFANRP
jgi:hypothetical protein